MDPQRRFEQAKDSDELELDSTKLLCHCGYEGTAPIILYSESDEIDTEDITICPKCELDGPTASFSLV